MKCSSTDAASSVIARNRVTSVVCERGSPGRRRGWSSTSRDSSGYIKVQEPRSGGLYRVSRRLGLGPGGDVMIGPIC